VLHVFLTDVSNYYVLVADGLFLFLFLFLFLVYLLNTQLVDIIKTCIHTEMRKKDTKHSGKKHTHIKHYKISKA